MQHVRIFLAALAVLCVSATIVSAQPPPPYNRTFVSAQLGNDANNCQPTTPCRNFAKALTNTVPGGEIIVLDSGGFGASLSITQPVSIEAPLGVYAGMSVLSGNGVTINTDGTVKIRGLTLNSNGGVNGFQIDSAAAVYLQNVSADSFSGKGINLVDDTTLTVINGTFRRNFDGIIVNPATGTAQVTLERVIMENHLAGSGLAITGSTRAVARNCIATRNHRGFSADGPSTQLVIEGALIAHAPVLNNSGVFGANSAFIRLSNSVITNVYHGVWNLNNADIRHRVNNTIEGVTNAFTGTHTTYAPL